MERPLLGPLHSFDKDFERIFIWSLTIIFFHETYLTNDSCCYIYYELAELPAQKTPKLVQDLLHFITDAPLRNRYYCRGYHGESR
jgi:hypothetical protein